MHYYYYVCDCRCCKTRIYIPCSKVVYEHVLNHTNSLVSLDLMFEIMAHECLGGIGILEVIQLIKSKEKLS